MRDRWKKIRNSDRFNIVERFYIFCEGEETEKNYFNGFKTAINKNPIYKRAIVVVPVPVGYGTTKLLEEALNYIKSNQITNSNIYLVFDKDDFSDASFNETVDKLNNLNNQKYYNNKYDACWSNESFEFWILLHFENTTTQGGRDEYKNRLSKHYNLTLGKEYRKNDPNIFDDLINFGNPSKAIKNAKQIINKHTNLKPSQINPGTKVYVLVDQLSKYLSDEQQSKFIIKSYNDLKKTNE